MTYLHAIGILKKFDYTRSGLKNTNRFYLFRDQMILITLPEYIDQYNNSEDWFLTRGIYKHTSTSDFNRIYRGRMTNVKKLSLSELSSKDWNIYIVEPSWKGRRFKYNLVYLSDLDLGLTPDSKNIISDV